MPRILIFTATYNESDNITSLINEIKKFASSADILIVDDSSPDGTGLILKDLVNSIPGLSVITRPRKAGLGSAHMLAIKKAINENYDYIITLDADFSHHPKYLPEIIDNLNKGYQFVIGSRYTRGGRCDYGFLRQALSRSANKLAILLLGLPLKESTTSYRGFSVSTLRSLDLNCIRSTGYSFFVEFVYRISQVSDKLIEVPIHFEDRRAGTSKISKIEIFKGMFTLVRLSCDRALTFFGLRRSGKEQTEQIQPIQPCVVCGFTESTILFRSNSLTGHDDSQYQCTNTHHGTHGQISRCLGCGLIATNPQLPAAQIQALYADVEDKIYLENISARQKTFRYNLKRIKSYLPSAGNLLDVGTYCGVFLDAAKEEGYRVSGVEPSRWASAYSRNKGYDVFCGTLKDLPASNEKFDIITSWDVLEHVSNPMQELCEVNNRLRIGGVFAFSTLHMENWFPKLMGERWPWYMDMHLYYFTNSILKHMLSQTGFEVINQKPYCHIITGEYLVRKLQSLGVPMKWLTGGNTGRLLRKIYVPFRFGDIQVTVARKIKDIPAAYDDSDALDHSLKIAANT